MAKKAEESKFLTYKGKPLVRNGDTIYYGNMKDKFVVKMTIKSKKQFEDMELADKVSIQLLSTDQELSPRKRVIKVSEKNGLYYAIDIADVWLERALSSRE